MKTYTAFVTVTVEAGESAFGYLYGSLWFMKETGYLRTRGEKNIYLPSVTLHLHPDPVLLMKYSVFLAQEKILTRLRFSHSSGSMQNYVLASGVDPQPAFSVECACSAEKVRPAFRHPVHIESLSSSHSSKFSHSRMLVKHCGRSEINIGFRFGGWFGRTGHRGSYVYSRSISPVPSRCRYLLFRTMSSEEWGGRAA